MRITPEQITIIAQNIQRKIGTKTNTYHQYSVHFDDTGITIHGAQHHLTVPTSHLSDIHAILQQCHPDGNYYIECHTDTCKSLPGLMLYSYGTRPSRLTFQSPLYRKIGHYSINLMSIQDIRIDPNDTMQQSIKHAVAHLNNHITFIDNDPNIRYYDTFVRIKKHIHVKNNEHLTFELYATSTNYSDDIQVNVEIYNESQHLCGPQFIIPIAHKDQLPNIIAQYTTQIARAAMKNMLSCTESHKNPSPVPNIPPHQHIYQTLTTPDSQLSHYMQRCVQILHEHYVYTSHIQHR